MHPASRTLLLMPLAVCLALLTGCWNVDVITDLADQRVVQFDYTEEVTFESVAGPAKITLNGIDCGTTPVTVRVPFGNVTAKQQGECVIIEPSDNKQYSPYGEFHFDFIGNGYTPKARRDKAYLFIGVIGETPQPTRWTGAVVMLRRPLVTVTSVYESGGACRTLLEPKPPEKAFQSAFEQAGFLNAQAPEKAALMVARRVVLTGPDEEPAAGAPAVQKTVPAQGTVNPIVELD
jgi:hypothetical protein